MMAGVHSDQVAPVRLRLREATRDSHDQVEGELRLLDGSLTPQRYREVLERFHGYYAVLEPALDAWHEREGLLDWPARRKLHLLAADLGELGAPDPADLPMCPEVLAIASSAEALGALYVIEGSTLGGAVIARRLRAQGFAPSALGFFSCYGSDVGGRWRTWSEVTTAWVGGDRARSDAVVAAARTVFSQLGGWLTTPHGA
jgi:heme oxygenase